MAGLPLASNRAQPGIGFASHERITPRGKLAIERWKQATPVMPHDLLLARLTSAFAEVPGVAAIVLGGSRARGSAHAAWDNDIGLAARGSPLKDTRSTCSTAMLKPSKR